MRYMQRAIAALAIGAALAQPVAAQVVFDGGAPTGLGSNPMSSLITAQGFSLSATTTFNAIRFWGFSGNADDAPFAGSFTWRLYNRSGSSFGSQIGAGIAEPTAQLRVANVFFFSDSYQYDFGVGMRTLGAGDYFLEFANATAGFTWERTSENDAPTVIRSSGTGQALVSSNDVAFQLRMVTVSEPSNLAIAAAGVVLVGMQATRRRRRLASR